MNLLNTPSIERICFGATERIDVATLISDVIQDDEYALDIAREMRDGRSPYDYNEDAEHPRFYERFRVIDVAALAAQITDQEIQNG